MDYLWMLISVLAGLWTGLLLPQVMERGRLRREDKAAHQVEHAQEQLLDEWLYGDKTDIGG